MQRDNPANHQSREDQPEDQNPANQNQTLPQEEHDQIPEDREDKNPADNPNDVGLPRP